MIKILLSSTIELVFNSFFYIERTSLRNVLWVISLYQRLSTCITSPM